MTGDVRAGPGVTGQRPATRARSASGAHPANGNSTIAREGTDTGGSADNGGGGSAATGTVVAGSITVVIPTIGRPSLVDAIRSVLAQTSPVGEIIVAADTDKALALPTDPRIRVIRTGPGAGGNVARQRGIESARGAVIALLDDDDLWLPNKIGQQLRLLNFQRPATPAWVVGCSVLAVGSAGETEIWPYRVIRQGEDLAEYMFVRHDLRLGHGFLQASGLVFPRALALAVPFRPLLRFHQDVTWLIDVSNSCPDLQVIQSQVPLVTYTVGSGSVSTAIRSAQSVAWAKEYLGGRSPRAVGDFLATVPVYYARREHSPSSAVTAFRSAFSVGRPSWRAITYAALNLLIMIPELALSKGSSTIRGVRNRVLQRWPGRAINESAEQS